MIGTPRSASLAGRVAILRRVRELASLPVPILDDLAAQVEEGRYRAGAVIVTEGEVGDRAFVIADGRAEVSTMAPGGTVPLATIEAGELVGEIALLSTSGRRHATVTALTDVGVIAIEPRVFRALLHAHAGVREAFAEAASERLALKFLKRASPFGALPQERLERLLDRLVRLSAGPGEAIVRQGDEGDSCYLVRSGRVEVTIAQPAGGGRRVATLGSGTFFGEAALLTGAPRNATVRALEPTELLVLRRADLLDAMGTSRRVAGCVVELLHLRARPKQAPDVEAHERINPDGETITVLKDRRRYKYYRLSPEGRFVWDRLDGHRSLRDLTVDYLAEFKSFAPQAIAQIIGGLADAGFLEGPSLRADVSARVFRPAWFEALTRRARAILEWRISVPVDALVTRLYQRGVFLIYTRLGQAILATVAIAGLIAFLALAPRATGTVRTSPAGLRLLFFIVPAYVVAIVVHEAGHAFTTKAFGREVPRAGIGWYWFGPIAYVDTSDMWLAGRWPRVAVNLAGVYANLVLAGAAALVALGIDGPVATAALWQFSLASYVGVLVNLNPLMEYDGYYVLIDWLERPNLRARALVWLGRELPHLLRAPRALKAHAVEASYGLAAILYVLAMASLVLITYRLFLERWIASVLPAGLAAGLAWLAGGAVVVLAGMSVAGELRESPRPEGRVIA